ncbi:sugar phosphate isomerase/epimerase family protein [Flexithrix dorotheae]|uniref:sugar phosphate isomerase/epimerase family protein n=1 Tax=Flexithrix dorotheae TaxID=70993 RepID=UPI00037B5409|nr:sugar phosphate isomerase/epimerase family protein [Flexithrix dorotheae]
MADLSKLCIHTITTKPWKLAESVEQYARVGVKGISVWQDSAMELGAKESGDIIRGNGLEVVSYVRGGFFPNVKSAEREKAIDHNKQMIEEAAELGAPMLVLVCGAEPAQTLEESRKQIQDGIESVLDFAEKHKVQVTIEPLHPMYADTRSAINTLQQANEMAEAIDSKWVGVAVDVYHLWWDPDLENQIKRCHAGGNFSAFHICDWNVPTTDMLLDRGLMGEGCIKLDRIKKWVMDTGFDGFHEVEIFSNKFWEMDQKIFLDKIVKSYSEYWED